MPQDALHTYRGREYGDWNEFSFIDSRRLIKLKKGDRIKIVESYFNSDVFKVILLDGFYKNKTYYRALLGKPKSKLKATDLKIIEII